MKIWPLLLITLSLQVSALTCGQLKANLVSVDEQITQFRAPNCGPGQNENCCVRTGNYNTEMTCSTWGEVQANYTATAAEAALHQGINAIKERLSDEYEILDTSNTESELTQAYNNFFHQLDRREFIRAASNFVNGESGDDNRFPPSPLRQFTGTNSEEAQIFLLHHCEEIDNENLDPVIQEFQLQLPDLCEVIKSFERKNEDEEEQLWELAFQFMTVVNNTPVLHDVQRGAIVERETRIIGAGDDPTEDLSIEQLHKIVDPKVNGGGSVTNETRLPVLDFQINENVGLDPNFINFLTTSLPQEQVTLQDLERSRLSLNSPMTFLQNHRDSLEARRNALTQRFGCDPMEDSVTAEAQNNDCTGGTRDTLEYLNSLISEYDEALTACANPTTDECQSFEIDDIARPSNVDYAKASAAFEYTRNNPQLHELQDIRNLLASQLIEKRCFNVEVNPVEATSMCRTQENLLGEDILSFSFNNQEVLMTFQNQGTHQDYVSSRNEFLENTCPSNPNLSSLCALFADERELEENPVSSEIPEELELILDRQSDNRIYNPRSLARTNAIVAGAGSVAVQGTLSFLESRLMANQVQYQLDHYSWLSDYNEWANSQTIPSYTPWMPYFPWGMGGYQYRYDSPTYREPVTTFTFDTSVALASTLPSFDTQSWGSDQIQTQYPVTDYSGVSFSF